jgi:RNA polymerase sigma-70 factor (ECF subfamily)
MADELDSATLSASRHGDAAAFRQLVEHHQDRVYGLCLALAGSDAEDVAQETFVRVHAALPGFDPVRHEKLSSWILTIARRLCADRARNHKRRQELQLHIVAAEPRPGADEQLDQARRRATLQKAVAALPEDQRAVVALRAWDGLEYEEIAAIERVPIGTVRSRLARAKQALKRALGLDEDEERHGSVDA